MMRVKVGGVPPDVVPVSLQEAQLGVVQNVEVGAAQAVARRTDEEVPVVFTGLPPDRQVEGGPAQLEAGQQQRVTENLREESVDITTRRASSLICAPLYVHRNMTQQSLIHKQVGTRRTQTS